MELSYFTIFVAILKCPYPFSVVRCVEAISDTTNVHNYLLLGLWYCIYIIFTIQHLPYWSALIVKTVDVNIWCDMDLLWFSFVLVLVVTSRKFLKFYLVKLAFIVHMIWNIDRKSLNLIGIEEGWIRQILILLYSLIIILWYSLNFMIL